MCKKDVYKLDDVDEKTLRKIILFAKFNSLFGEALENHFFHDDLEEAKNIKLNND